MIEYRNLRVAILGGGSVGSQVASLLLKHGSELADRAGAGLELVGVAVRNPDAPHDTDIPAELITTDASSLILGADIVVHAEYLPGDVRPGDLLGVPATGAYGWAMASNYNYLGRPPVVAVVDGVARVIVRGENEDDLLARDMGERAASGEEK